MKEVGMKDIGDIEMIYKASELLDEFCANTYCPGCLIKKLCNKMDKNIPIGQKLIKSIEI